MSKRSAAHAVHSLKHQRRHPGHMANGDANPAQDDQDHQ
jgi:hypothetical protein